MNVNNPFLFITPRNSDVLVGRHSFLETLEKKVLESLDTHAIIAVNGPFGIGKSQFIYKIIEDLKTRKNIKIFNFDFNLNTLNDLRSVPHEKDLKKQIIIVIDRFELIESLTKEIQHKVLNVMAELCDAKDTFILETSSDLIKKVADVEPNVKKYFNIINVPQMNYDEVKKLIYTRLNEVRKDKSESINPFTEEEVKMIHKQSKGNPRMVLMLCASLYEKKN
ncbi:ATPase domain predominantly from Archaea [Candidatus Tiddalikarchaeum anstoanum]|nr:ATPase domain predominantly from Archaea [Candidatus Tiddalikarchaeum anstoanum]